jgi:hypothetical protein
MAATLQFLTRRPKLTADFDAAGDVLNVVLGKPVPAEGSGLPGGIELDFAIEDGKPCGATVIGYRRNGWVERTDELAARIGAHLAVRPQIVAEAIRVAVT